MRTISRKKESTGEHTSGPFFNKNKSRSDVAETGTNFFQPPAVQAKCDACEAAEPGKEEQEGMVHKKGNGQGGSAASAGIESSLQASKGKGATMPDNVRANMETAFGEDFSEVKVHTDANAMEMNEELNAHAFTHGNDIYFNEGEYNPGSNNGRHLLAHELTHTIQQGGQVKKNDLSSTDGQQVIQRDDARFESGTGLSTALTSGSMTADSLMGQTIIAPNCRGLFGCDVGFTFEKAYTGTFPYRSARRDVKGVYVKIVSDYNHAICGNCDTIRFIQTIRNITRNASGDVETADPGSETRRERSGWGDAAAPSRGWRVDRISSATNPFYGNAGFNVEVGSTTQPATFWDAPGDWSTDTNVGKDFQTFLVCESASGDRKTIAGINWGYYTDGSGNISFRPATPIAFCGPSQELQDAVTRWNDIEGNTDADIDFAGEHPVSHEGERTTLWFDLDSTNLRNDADITAAAQFAQYELAVRNTRQHIMATFLPKIVIHGYASVDGDPGYNMDLSRRRAEYIKSIMVAEGIPEYLIEVQAHGPNGDQTPQDRNRRVEIELTHRPLRSLLPF